MGQDDHFPFGPHRMFSTRNELNGRVNSAQLTFTFADGTVRPIAIDSHTVGLRRAEVEGLEDRFVARPQLLSHLADVYESFNPSEPEIVAAELIERTTDLEQGQPVGRPTTRVPGCVVPLMDAIGRWWFEPLPVARIAWLRTFLYSFVFVDVLLTTSWVARHGAVSTELYEPFLSDVHCRFLNPPERWSCHSDHASGGSGNRGG